MPTSSTQRNASPAELDSLRKLLSQAPTTATRLKRGASNAFVLWATSLLLVVVAWLAVGWVLGKALNQSFGLQSSATALVAATATPLCAAFAVWSSVKWVRGWPDYGPQLSSDIANALVVEDHYVFAEAKRFQEPEHGGLIYFLRSTEDEVFTVYDHESQTRGVDGLDPLESGYRPRTNLLVVRAPSSGFVLSTQSSGTVLPVAAPIELALRPSDWPEADAITPVPWGQLEQHFGPNQAASASRGDA